MPVLPSCVLDPIRVEFLASLPDHVETHPLGCHNPRIADAVVFDHLIAALVTGLGYERVADSACSATTMRRRRDDWIKLGLFAGLKTTVLGAYQKMVGLDLGDVAIDGCLVKAPAGGEVAGPSPVDRRKQGTKRSQLTEAEGIPLAIVAAGANRPDHTLLPASLDTLDAFLAEAGQPAATTVHLDSGYDYAPCRQALAAHGVGANVTPRGQQVPIGWTKRWPVERTNSWMNNFGRLRRCTERRAVVVQAWLDLAAAIITVRALIRRCWDNYRWPNRPRSKRIR